MIKRSRMAVAESAGFYKGACISVSGEKPLRVIRVHGLELTVTRWRWYHTAASWVRRRITDARWAVQAEFERLRNGSEDAP